MYIEKNICNSLLKFLLGENDTAAVREDFRECGILQCLWLQERADGRSYIMPHAPYVFTAVEKEEFFNLLRSFKVLTRYMADLASSSKNGKFQGLKSHDFHIMLQHILLACVRHLLRPGPREAIIRLGQLFQRLTTKVVDPIEIPSLKLFTAETLSLLEKNFPEAFFDSMVHLVMHLPNELAICGLVGVRWCYLLERYLMVYKNYVCTKARLEASIACGYALEESLGFVTEYFQLFRHSERRIWDSEPKERDCSEVLEGRPNIVELREDEVRAIHDYVIQNSVATEELFR
jgi:hypothetical protein